MKKIISRYNQTLKTFGWAIIGLIVSLSIINSKSPAVLIFGYPLLMLSIMMIPLAVKYYLKEFHESKR